MSIQCKYCYQIAEKGHEIGHTSDCLTLKIDPNTILPFATKENAEERKNKLYISNTSAQWAKEQLDILIHMVDAQNPLHEVTSSIKASPWVYMELIRIRDGIRTVDG